MQILKGLYQVSGDLSGITFDEPGAMWNDGNTYVLDTGKGLVMFDCGCGNTIDQIFENMEYWELSPDDIRYCLLTHPHFDHAGGAYILKKRGVQLIAIGETADAVAIGDERCAGYLYHKVFHPVTVDLVVNDTDQINLLGVKIGVMHLPGHSMGCTGYLVEWERRRVVVSGDVIGTLLKGDFGWDGSIDFDKKNYIASLRRLAELDSDIMLPGHGMIYFHEPRRRVEEVLNAALMQWR